LKHNYRVIEPETLLDVFTKFELIKIEDEFIVVLTEKVFEMEKNVLFKSPLLTMFNMIQREVIHNAFLWINRLKKSEPKNEYLSDSFLNIIEQQSCEYTFTVDPERVF